MDAKADESVLQGLVGNPVERQPLVHEEEQERVVLDLVPLLAQLQDIEYVPIKTATFGRVLGVGNPMFEMACKSSGDHFHEGLGDGVD